MAISKDRVNYLLQAWTSRKATSTEEAELFDYVKQSAQEGEVENHIQQLVAEYTGKEPVPSVDWETLYGKVLANRQMETEESLPVIPAWKKITRVASVAAIFLLIATGGWLYFNNKPATESAAVQNASPYKNDIDAPKDNKATLTVDGGDPIVLSELKNGSLEKAGIAGAFKTGENKISYDGNATVIVYQTLSNPLGSKPQELSLPDGSMVWLNAGSSIRYPSKFTGPTRSVSMTGEAYFEVKHDASQPFSVSAGNQVIEDLGTSFNVKAYKDEPVIKTTLVEGIVKIGNVTLKPGEQFNGTKVSNANIAQETAWKNGQFYFSHNTVESILQQAMRWYDIEVEYKGKVNETFTINVDRDLPISKLLQYMEKSGGVHFEIEGKKVIVKP